MSISEIVVGRFLLISLFVFALFPESKGQLLINEIMPSNATVLEDRFGEYPDWIELYNSGSEAIQLEDYFLSDDSTFLQKWQFPVMSLSADSYMLVFASGRDLSEAATYWHTMINLGEEWRYYLPESFIGSAWKSDLSATSDWEIGKSSFGYGDADDTTVVSSTISLYIQKEFEIDDLDEVLNTVLYMDYNDGFVAYLNGSEIARSSSMSKHGTNIQYDDLAKAHVGAMWQGGLPEAYDFSENMDLLNEGSNILAIEVHNDQSFSLNLSCFPFLMINYKSFQPDLLRNNEYLSLRDYFPHTNFKIDSDGEAIYLSNSSGELKDSMPNIQVPSDYSYGRILQVADSCAYFQLATPGTQNSEFFATDFLVDSVAIVVSGTPFSAGQQIELLSKNTEDSIFYTLDFSEPSINSNLYSGLISVNSNSVIRARIIKDNALPGPVSTRTVFTTEKHTLPVISVTSDSKNLWDFLTGIYVKGPGGNTSKPYYGANFWQDWEKPAHFELLDVDGNLVFESGAGTRIFGGWSRGNPQKSMSLFARSHYSVGSFSHQLFQKKNIDEFSSFILRTGGDDWNRTMFSDAISGYLANEMDLDHQAYEPYVQYLNGEYWGIINMREKISEHFLANNHLLDDESINLLENKVLVKHGNADRYEAFLSFIRNNDLSLSANYEEVKKYIDVENFIRYWTLNVYIDNKDWPANNMRFWATEAPGSLFRWIIYDTDFGYSIWSSDAYKLNTLKFSFSEALNSVANPKWATEVVRTLLDNEEFRIDFINSFADGMNYNFSYDRMLPVVDSFEQRVSAEAVDHFAKWGGSMNTWHSRVDVIREYFQFRPEYMKDHLMERFDLSGLAQVGLEIKNGVGGSVRINSIQPDTYPFEGSYFNDIPIEIEAIPDPGYKFVKWEGTLPGTKSLISYDMSEEASFVAVFKEVNEEARVVINEINYSSAADRDTEDWVELYNYSSTPVDLSGWYLSDESSGNSYTIQDKTILAIGGYMVFCTDVSEFRKFYPERNPVQGNLGFGLNNEGEGIALFDKEGNLHDAVKFESSFPWPTSIGGTGATLELLSPVLDNSLAESWLASKQVEGTPCERNSQCTGVGIDETEMQNQGDLIAYPSPFSSTTSIVFTLEEEQNVTISVISITGSVVDIIESGRRDSGKHIVQWQPESTVSSGIYLLRLNNENDVQTLRIVYLGR